MAERIFQQELERGARHVGWHVVSIPDAGKGAAPRVYDLGLLRQNAPYFAVELKEVSGSSFSWNISHLRPHQEENLLAAEREGGIGLVICNFAIRLSAKKQKQMGFEAIRRAFAVRIGRLLEEREKNCRTSFDYHWWVENGCEMITIEGLTTNEGKALRAWDPSNILADDRIQPMAPVAAGF